MGGSKAQDGGCVRVYIEGHLRLLLWLYTFRKGWLLNGHPVAEICKTK